MNLDEREHIIGIGTGIWVVWFIIEFLAIDYNSLCFEEFGNNTLCFNEAFLILPDFMYDLSEKISLLILGSYGPFIYYAFYCQENIQWIYYIIVNILGLITIILT